MIGIKPNQSHKNVKRRLAKHNVTLPGEEPKPIKMGSHLSLRKISEYTKPTVEFKNIIA